jgi:hypothetical protein
MFYISNNPSNTIFLLIDRFNLCNLAHHHADFNTQASWSFTASGHGKGPCDGLGAVVKSTATQYLLKGGPNVSFSTPKEFFEWCLQRNDRFVIARTRLINSSNVTTNYMPEPNRPIEVRWLSTEMIQNEYGRVLQSRWNHLSPKSDILRH